MKTDYLIIGGGPTGLGAASRLEERGLDWRLLEAESDFGGLSASSVDENGFTWDMGGHVQFSHYETFDRYMDLALGRDGWFNHERESWIWVKDRFVPYPFQYNLHRLDSADRDTCVKGLQQAREQQGSAQPRNFEEWMLAAMGKGVCDLFMRPYNYKVWAFPPSMLDYHWIAERVAVPDLDKVEKAIRMGQDEVSWGPNRLFRFPKRGGTGAVWRSIGRRLPQQKVSLTNSVEAIDVARKQVRTRGGEIWQYRYLINSMPLNKLIRIAPGVVREEVAGKLLFSGTNVVGVGLDGSTPSHLKTKCWMYFPMSNSPYYRVTVFSNYSLNNAARPGEQWSLMAETSESPAKPVDRGRLVDETVRALMEDRLIPEGSKIVSKALYHLEQGYPTPFLGRDGVVDPILRAFEKESIFSRGRFGAWKYEVANQDHSFAQGYECVERLTRSGGPEFEPTLFTPYVVNSRRNP